MPSIDESLAMQIDAIERHHKIGKALTTPEVMFLVSTLRREMAINMRLRAQLAHLCQSVERTYISSRGLGRGERGNGGGRP